ncbi:hypothetical protein NAI59_11140, partial [Francisella tularensis subsp. holarctica]|nr:hypothetical protein [Francisella tularensis subsp. holarctica]
NKSQSQDIRYVIFSIIVGAYCPTNYLDTKPQKGQIELLSSTLAKVEFALYPQKIQGLATNGKIDIIFSHSKAVVYQFDTVN